MVPSGPKPEAVFHQSIETDTIWRREWISLHGRRFSRVEQQPVRGIDSSQMPNFFFGLLQPSKLRTEQVTSAEHFHMLALVSVPSPLQKCSPT
jgi:hypothetical protein